MPQVVIAQPGLAVIIRIILEETLPSMAELSLQLVVQMHLELVVGCTVRLVVVGPACVVQLPSMAER